MIDYALAKELEDAGFPRGNGVMMHDNTVEPSLHYYIPTLEEVLAQLPTATHIYKGKKGFSVRCYNRQIISGHRQYPTAFEAAVRLWLALNKPL